MHARATQSECEETEVEVCYDRSEDVEEAATAFVDRHSCEVSVVVVVGCGRFPFPFDPPSSCACVSQCCRCSSVCFRVGAILATLRSLLADFVASSRKAEDSSVATRSMVGQLRIVPC